MEKIEAGRDRITTTLENITKNLSTKPVLNFMGKEPREFSLYIGAMAKESFFKTLQKAGPTECAVIVGDRIQIQMKAIMMGVPLVIISGGFKVSKEVKAAAKKAKTSLVISPFDSATTALFVRLSTPASLACLTKFQKAAPDELASDLKFKIKGGNGLVVLDDTGRLEGIITKTNLLSPSGTSLILVDHNELSQAIDGAENVEILQVVDHHRIGNFTSTHAIPFICEPLGATSSIVSELYKASGKPIKKKTASLLLAGVISDTVILKSPTTTERDKKIVKWLESMSGLKHKALGKIIFSATSSIKKRGAEAVVRGDHKTFDVKGQSFGIGQVETIGFTEFFEEKAALTKELKRVESEMGLNLSAVLITDIVLGTSLLLVTGEKRILYSLGYTKLSDGLFELKDVISRKKQVVPHILSVFNEIY
jgi:manganese-dependent inorganic pyrophosphatase